MITRRAKRILDGVSHYSVVKSAVMSEDLIVRKGFISDISSKEAVSYHVRLWGGKRFVSAEVSSIDEKVAQKLVRMLRVAPELDFFHGLPEAKRFRKVEVFDKELSLWNEDSLVEDAREMIGFVSERGGKTGDVQVGMGHVGVLQGVFSIETSEGVAGEYQSTYYSSSLSVTASGGGRKSSFWDSIESRRLVSRKIKRACWGNAVDNALEGLRQRRIRNLPKTVVLSPVVAADLIEYAFLPNFTLEKVRDRTGRYSLKDVSDGKILFDSELRIFDNPVMKFGINSYPFDFDGSRPSKVELVKDGRVAGFISDYNTARELGVKNTGHAGRNEAEFSNVVISGRDADVDSYILVKSVIGAHTSNPATTEFSVVADSAVVVRDGEATPVVPFMMFGSMEAVLSGASFSGRREVRNGISVRNIVTDRVRVSF